MVGRMPKYFFDAYDGRQHCVDSQGEDLDDDQEACAQANAILNALISDDRDFGRDCSYHVSVRRDTTLVCQLNCAMTKVSVTGDESVRRISPKKSHDFLGSEQS